MAARRLLLRWLFGFSTMLLSSVMAQDDEFEHFRCDACSATFFKNGFGVKQHEAYETLQDQEKRRKYDQALLARDRPGMSRAQKKEYWRQKLEFQAKELAAAKEALRMAQERAAALGRKKGNSGKSGLGKGSSCQESGMFGGGSGGGSSGKPFGKGSSGSPFSNGNSGTPFGGGSSQNPFSSGSSRSPISSGNSGTPFGGGNSGNPCGTGNSGSPFGIGSSWSPFSSGNNGSPFGAGGSGGCPPGASSSNGGAVGAAPDSNQAEETATPPEWSTDESPDPSAGTTPTQSTSSSSHLLPASASAGGLGAASSASTGWDNGGCWGGAGHNYGKASCKGCFSEVTDQVFIGDLPGAFTQEQMTTIFGAYGTVLKSKLLTPAASSGMRAAIIQFSSVDQAKWIVENLNGNIPEGMDAPIKVRYIQMGTATTAAWGASPYGENGKGNSFAASGYQSSNKLFIGDLVADVTEEEMSAVFGAYGNITGSKLLAPNSNGKRAAIIQYATAVEAKWIVEHLDGKIPQGMNGPVKVGYEMDKEPVAIAPAFAAWSRSNLSNTGGKGGKGAKNGKAVSKCKASVLVKGLYESGALPGGSGVGSEANAVIIFGLPADTTDLHLYQMFSVFGSIPPKGVRAMFNDDGSCTGIGFVNFLDGAFVDNAISTLNGTRMPDGSVLLVSLMLEGSTGKTVKGGKGGK